MHPPGKALGIMKPLGGGDPITLKKPELTIGRRPTCDIRLDFENVSGKHCQLRFVRGTWHVRDLNSTNGTTKNGQTISSEHDLLPDDELGIAGHLYFIDYEPTAPSQVLEANQVLEGELNEGKRQRSLMELAGLETDYDHRRDRPERAAERIGRPSAAESEFDDPAGDRHTPDVPLPKVEANDDDFFRLIQEDVDTSPPKGR